MRRVLVGSILPALFIAIWEISSRIGILTLESLSRPSDILLAGIAGLVDGSILIATGQTFETALIGFAFAAVTGIIAGAALGLSPVLERVVDPTIEALRPIPAVAFIPLSLMMFGFGVPMEATIVAYACVWPILIVTISAVKAIEPRLLEVADTLEMNFVERLRKIILPAAFVRINVGLRVATGIALVVAVTVEIVLNPRGLGYSLMLAQQSLRVDIMYAQLLWLCMIGYVLNALLRNIGPASIVLSRAGR
jgi:ABC-type nitrate/sulfonate/bicarbonate transport system permease component